MGRSGLRGAAATTGVAGAGVAGTGGIWGGVGGGGATLGAGAGWGAGSGGWLGADELEAAACAGRGTLCATCAEVFGRAAGGWGRGRLRHSSSRTRWGRSATRLRARARTYLERARVSRDLAHFFVVEHRVEEHEVHVFVGLQGVFVRVLGQLLFDTVQASRAGDELDAAATVSGFFRAKER